MRKILTLLAVVLCIFGASAQQKKADKQTAQWRYEIQPVVGEAAQGTALVRIWTYSKSNKVAISQAAKNAVHAIMFKGYPASNDGTRIVGREPLIADPAIEEKKAEYFEEFFKEGGAYQRYVSFVNNGVPDQILKVNKEYKIGITVVIMIDQLRERLEQDGILAPTTTVQGKMPTVMIVPSKVYCNNHKCMKTYNNQGQTEYIQDFEKALLDNDLNQAITALNARLVARGFETKNLSSALNTLKTEKAENAVMMSIEGGASVAETPIDVLRRVANADIWIEINWTENTIKGGSEKTLTFSMSAIDSYTDFVVGGIPPTTSHNSFSSSFNIALAIESAIQGQFDPFCNTMVDYFKTLAAKGRAIKVRVFCWDDWDGNLMEEYDGDELNEIIEDWLADNTVGGKFGAPAISPSGKSMTIEQVRMPLTDAKGRDNDPKRWARGLRNKLKEDYSIPANISTKGLGELLIIVGSK